MAVAPAAAIASSPSRNGKKASDAATEPASGFRASVLPAFITATCTASTRLIWPAPMASVRDASVKITALDFTCAQMRQANRSAVHSGSVGDRFVAIFRPAAAAAFALHG